MLRENYPYCGDHPENFNSTNKLYKSGREESESKRSWWCCFGAKNDESLKEHADEYVVTGKYEKRRSTVAYNQRLSNFAGVRKKIQDAKFGYLTAPPKLNLRFLIVFNTEDLTLESLKRAAEKLDFEVTVCRNVESAFDEFQSKHHDLVAIDARSLKTLDYETLCGAIKMAKGSQHAPVIAVVKKSLFEREDGAVLNLLEIGFNRCILESSSVTNYVNEITQLKLSDMKPMAQKSTTQALYAALDKCNSMVFITDENYKCQYANVMIERFLNIHQEEIVGKNLLELILYDQPQMKMVSSYLLRGREWTGELSLKKKSQEIILSCCKGLPIACYGRLPTHFVLILDVSNIEDNGQVMTAHQRRASESRKASLNRLTSLPIEAPITKIFSLLDQLREKLGNNYELIYILDKAEDMLKSCELYSTQLKENRRIRPEEPVVSDLITALLSDQSQKMSLISSRRNSNESTRHRTSKTIHMYTEIDELLETALQWDFEIFRLEEISRFRPLQYLGMYLCQHFDIANALNCDERTLKNWFIIIESHYHNENYYHNSTHAADVMQATAGFLERHRIKAILEPLDEAMCLLASAAHDVDHPGKSSAFLANSDNSLAILYNDITILENHHVACMFKLSLGDERVNVFKNLDRDTYKIVRHNIIDMILATEMTKHFEHLTKFVNVFCARPGEEDDTGDFISLSLPENITLIKRMLIKCADVSNPTRPFRLYVEWARRIAEEYFQQTDEEKVKGLPVVMPMFDRNTCSVPKSQIGFVDYIVNDMFEAWNAFIDMPELITYLRQNYMRWREFDEQGHRTLADIRHLQSSVLLAPILPQKPIILAT